MDSKKYINDALATESSYEPAMDRLFDVRTARLVHGLMGLVTESAEAVDVLKKHVFYGKPIDLTNLAEELGDLFWYMAILCDELDVEFEQIMSKNIAKLRARYGNQFSQDKALNRDLDKEKAVLKG
jgi:NTP pyrophosphatase (non-canonical NTP hydrolase)